MLDPTDVNPGHDTGARLPPVSLFMPTYNSERFIGQSVERVHALLSMHFGQFEIVVVDDTSTDRTCEIVEQRSHHLEGLRLVRFEDGPSRRENLGLAMLEARFDHLLFIDSDLSPDIGSIPQLMRVLADKQADVVIGSRYIDGTAERTLYRRLLSVVYNRMVRTLFNSPYVDHNCGLKGFTREAYAAIAQGVGHDPGHRRGWFWDVELLMVAGRLGMKIHEHPVRWAESPTSTFSLARELKAVPYMAGLLRQSPSGRLR